jgi:hypothetical protein
MADELIDVSAAHGGFKPLHRQLVLDQVRPCPPGSMVPNRESDRRLIRMNGEKDHRRGAGQADRQRQGIP